LAISAASPNCWAVIYQFDGSVDNAFLTPNNWSIPPGMTADPGVPGVGDRAIINNNFVVTYGTAVTTTLGSLIVGADWPVTGELGTDGTLNMTAGKFIVTGGGDNFQIARARGAVFGDGDGDGLLMMTNAELQIGGSDPIVGTRDHGVLDVGLNAKVYNTPGQDNYWRLGNYGPSVDAGLEGNGLLNVHSNGTFNAHVIFIGDNDATGELRVSDTGSVILTGNLVPRPSGFQAGGSATVRMSGSNAILQAFNLESESLPGEIRTKYRFDADALGASEIKLTDAINITNNDLEVNLDGFVLPSLGKVLLFDGDQALVGSRVFGTFANLTVNGVLNPSNYAVVYDQVNGDISLQRVPEPSTALLVLLGVVMAIAAKRRTSR
jgi:PEP-CTERM motif-containing protein